MKPIEQAGFECFEFTRAGRVLTVAINLPAQQNIVTEALHEEMADLFYAVAKDPESDIIVLTGKGGVFCAGGDLNWLARELDEGLPPFIDSALTMRRIVGGLLDCPKPVIAKVNGDAIGFGASLALLCDVVIASEKARFADPHVKLGLSAGDGGALIWPQLIGFAKAKHYLMTGDAVDATEAERIGLITFVKPENELDEFVSKYANKLAAGAQTAIRYTKSAANLPLRQLAASVYELSLTQEGLTRHTSDYEEGVRAFVEKRRPKFTGR